MPGVSKAEIEEMREEIYGYLDSIERYNSSNLAKFQRYVELQVSENFYDLEANLALLKLYQFFPNFYDAEIVCWILLKAISNLPHSDFVLCRCLLGPVQLEDLNIQRIVYLANLLEVCQFKKFWEEKAADDALLSRIVGFNESIKKFICHIVNISYQTIEASVLKELLGGIPVAELKSWIAKNGWKEENDMVFIVNQEDLIKTKNINEKITFDTLSFIV